MTSFLILSDCYSDICPLSPLAVNNSQLAVTFSTATTRGEAFTEIALAGKRQEELMPIFSRFGELYEFTVKEQESMLCATSLLEGMPFC